MCDKGEFDLNWIESSKQQSDHLTKKGASCHKINKKKKKKNRKKNHITLIIPKMKVKKFR